MVAAEFHTPLHHPSGRRNIVGACGTDRVVAVPIAPVECVHREKRRKDSQPLVGIHLILAQELAVDEDRPTIGFTVLFRRRFDGSD